MGPLVGQLTAHQSQVAVIGGDVHGNVIFGGELRSPADSILDFRQVIEVALRDFVGRREVFAALQAFQTSQPCGYFEIVADAGLGKTSLAAEIVRRFNAIPFFASASLAVTEPKQFLTHLSAALITRYKLPYEHLPARAGDDSTFFASVLEQAAGRDQDPLWIVIDGLDEAEPPPRGANPLLLPAHLPAHVYMVVTHRPGGRIWTQPDTPRASYELHADAAEQEADVEELIRRRATEDDGIKAALARARPAVRTEDFVSRLLKASRGNFMYLRYVLGDIAARNAEGKLLDLDRLPDGLQGYYEQFWSDMEEAKAEGWADWKGLYRPTIERLAVAAEAVTAEWLGAQIGRDSDEVRERALQRWTRLLNRDTVNTREVWRVIHRSFADFLEQKVDVAAAHRAVATFYATNLCNRWNEFDDYGLRHTPMHLAAAAGAEHDPAKRHTLTKTLSSLILAPGFQQAHLARHGDPSAFERAIDLAVRQVAVDDLATAGEPAEVALRLAAFRKEQRQPQPIFDLAHDGNVVAAERRLDLFALEIDAAWYQALLLTIAWLGASRSQGPARALRNRVRKSLAGAPASPSLDLLMLLMARVDATLDGTPVPPLSLPPPPPPAIAQAIVRRLGASSGNRSLMSGADVELMNRREPTGPKGYLAEEDGRDLVAAVVADPAFGEPLLTQYVAMHAAYGYREYRQGSLWALLAAVLQHPSQDWTRTWVSALSAAVLAPNRGDFRESLGLAASALQAAAGRPGAADTLDRRRTDAILASETAEPLPPTNLVVDPPPRGQGDTWGTNRRRLAALAEALSRVPGQEPVVRPLLERALQLHWGFAGFNAPARLALAEAIEASSPDLAWISTALAGARTSAHNIQDATFCARTTARVQALAERWWGSPPVGGFNVVDAAGRLARDASGPEFAALHVIGQQYNDRDPGATIPLPASLLNATTVRQLAEAYERPLEEFYRLNSDQPLQADTPLPPGTRINVPDPGLAPLLAARFAARALADPALSSDQRQRVIRALLPVAAADATALDLVLARLLLASRTQDLVVLDSVVALAVEGETTAGGDAALTAQLTRFVP
jgi:hypothetical protein